VDQISEVKNVDKLPILPQGWAWVQLGDVAEYINGRAFKPTDWETSGRPIIRIQNLTSSKETINRYSLPIDEKFLIKDGDLLISWSATLGAFIYKGEEAVLNQHIFKVKPYIDKLFLFYLVTTYIASLKKEVHGTGMQHITKGKFEESPIPLPPAPEQIRIVSKIEELLTELDAGVASLKKVQAQLKRYRHAVLKAAFEGRLTQEWREDHEGEIECNDVIIFKADDSQKCTNLAEGWVWTKVEKFGEVIGGLTKNQNRSSYSLKLPYLRVANVYSNRIDLSDIVEIGVKESELNRLLLERGDLLVVEGNGSLEQIGRVAIWEGQIAPCVHQNHIIKIRLNPKVSGKYVLYWLISQDGRQEITNVASSTSGLYTLSISKVQSLNVPLANFSEQIQIVTEIERHFSQIDHLEHTITTSLRQAETLRQSILKRAFEGKLVPQDPNDEPASILLERIKAEKSRYAAEVKKGKTLQPKSPKRKIKNAN